MPHRCINNHILLPRDPPILDPKFHLTKFHSTVKDTLPEVSLICPRPFAGDRPVARPLFVPLRGALDDVLRVPSDDDGMETLPIPEPDTESADEGAQLGAVVCLEEPASGGTLELESVAADAGSVFGDTAEIFLLGLHLAKGSEDEGPAGPGSPYCC